MDEEKKEIKFLLLLHFYAEEKFIGQKLHWVSLESENSLCILLDLFSRGCKYEEVHETDRCPRDSVELAEIKKAFIGVHENLHNIGPLKTKNNFYSDFESADTVRVMQVIEGSQMEKSSHIGD